MSRAERLRRAESLVASGQLDAALAEYEALVAEHPRDLVSANAHGDLYVRAGHPDRARPHYEHVADSHAKEGFFARAAGFYKKVLKLVPDDAVVLAKLAEVMARQGLVVEAVTHFRSLERLLARRGDARGAAQVAARIEGLGPAAAAPVEGPARQAAPSTTGLALARTYVAAGMLAQARPLLEALHEEDPGDADVATLLAGLLERLGERDAAIACRERLAAARDPHPHGSPHERIAKRRTG